MRCVRSDKLVRSRTSRPPVREGLSCPAVVGHAPRKWLRPHDVALTREVVKPSHRVLIPPSVIRYSQLSTINSQLSAGPVREGLSCPAVAGHAPQKWLRPHDVALTRVVVKPSHRVLIPPSVIRYSQLSTINSQLSAGPVREGLSCPAVAGHAPRKWLRPHDVALTRVVVEPSDHKIPISPAFIEERRASSPE